MFTTLTILVCCALIPFVLATANPFHMIKEKHRYVKNNKEEHSNSVETIFASVCIGLSVALIIINNSFPKVIDYPLKYVGVIVIILAAFYLIKTGRSIFSHNPVSVLNIVVTKRSGKIWTAILMILLILTVLENLQLIPTY